MFKNQITDTKTSLEFVNIETLEKFIDCFYTSIAYSYTMNFFDYQEEKI